MNQKDRDRIVRLMGCVRAWPFPNRSKTLGIKEAGEFLHNMGELRRPFYDCLMAIARPDMESPEEELTELERMLREMGMGHVL